MTACDSGLVAINSCCTVALFQPWTTLEKKTTKNVSLQIKYDSMLVHEQERPGTKSAVRSKRTAVSHDHLLEHVSR